MRSGVINIVIGVVAVGFGASGEFGMFNSPALLMGVGAAITIYGVVQIVRQRRSQ
jgi:hypothetical protein